MSIQQITLYCKIRFRRYSRVATLLVSYVSIWATAGSFLPAIRSWSGLVALGFLLSILTFLQLLWEELKVAWETRIYGKGDTAAIHEYMRRWIAQEGRVAIWSRDVSWGDEQTFELLKNKAEKGELILCVPTLGAVARRLQGHNADIRVYSVNSFTPASRFTIVDFKKVGSRVAVGRTEGDLHVIEEFDSTRHPAFFLAQDLVDLVGERQESGAMGDERRHTSG